jgi:glycine cleavage system H protein
MDIPLDLRYSSDHEWVRVEGNNVRIGITAYAQDALGDVVFVQLPELGTAVVSGGVFSEVESTKSLSDIYAPVDGTIVDVNGDLTNKPELVNSSPYADGWLCVIAMTDPSQVDGLLDADAYRALTEA